MAVQEKFIGALVLYEKYRHPDLMDSIHLAQLESHMPMARWGSSCRLKTPHGNHNLVELLTKLCINASMMKHV